MNASAWRVGLRQGSRVVEVTMISPGAGFNFLKIFLEIFKNINLDGNPRRGCEDSNCPSVFVPDQSEEELGRRNQQQQKLKKLPPRVSPSSDSWSGPQPPSSSSLYAIPERKKFSAPSFGIQQPQRPLSSMQQMGKASIDLGSRNASLRTLDHCASEDDYRFMPVASSSIVTVQSSNIHDDAMIDGETNNQPQQYEQLSLEMRSVVTPQSYCAGSQLSRRSPALRTGTLQEQQEENDNENVSWRLQQTLEEKRALEVELEQIRARLSSEQRAHENTRRQLQIVKEYCERFSINPPSFEDEENDEEL
ncbi:unnamed protein product [Meloidogyne enterolobii]|uniref:Uncharacterized protein n=1 Tax=Meloidogyne enterolobii TaxID=390850 RepID=A0ACB0Y0R8_MELEN